MNIEDIQISSKQIANYCRQNHIRSLALFGSVLRGDFNQDSDIDVLIEFEPQAQIGLMMYARIQRELSELFQKPVDLVTRDSLKPLIKDNILNSAETIYAH